MGEVYLAHFSLAGNYHYQEHGVQLLILNKPVNKLISLLKVNDPFLTTPHP
jgi:hypothetical protein